LKANKSFKEIYKDSIFNKISLSLVPPEALYPPKLPSEHITLWQGLTIGIGFLPHAFATALYEFGLPIAIAISL
jgi:hypothetical protein